MKWIEKDNKLEREFEFKDFQRALDFVNKVGEIAEKNKHHPDIKIFDYKFVLISMTTHDKGNTITDKDRTLSSDIDKIDL